MAEGYVMTIPKSVLDNLEKADTKITQIAKNSEQARDRVRISFQAMADSVEPFLKQLDALKSLGKINIDASLKSSATSAEKTANSIAKVAVQLNKVAESPIDGVNRKIASMSQLIEQATHASERMQKNLSEIKSGSGSISRNTLGEGAAGSSLVTEAQSIIKVLELERAELQQNDRYWKTYIDTLNGSSIAAQKQKAEMDRLNDAFKSGQSELQKRAKEEDNLARANEKQAKAAEKAAKAAEKKNKIQVGKEDKEAARAVEQYNKALVKSEVTITQRARKIEALANAQRALTATGRDYSAQLSKIASETQRLKKANEDAANSMQKVKKSQSSVLSISDQLVRKLGLLFSVSSMQGYVNKLVAVRGEFELQNRALQSILQNKEKADEIWDKTVQLAVRSPFTVKELVTYTKQLAAYRIEADKLYDTNKMLADVSAGLGVSMDRLILAFGQVKAANYLRASEVRQFTEAGLNILGELSAIYTELEGKMVSVGDVQDRITKRMVTFGDVEEVFKRVTSAGGIFYNMQEVQAETLAGMMSNLQDSFDLMFNSIGQANEGTLKGFVITLKSIVENWELIAQIAVPIISTLVIRWGLLKASILLGSGAIQKFFKVNALGFKLMHAQITGNTVALTKLNRIIKATSLTKFSLWAVPLSAVVIVVWEIYNAFAAIRKEQEELNKIAAQGQFDATDKAANYERLANVISDATASYEEQDAALKELKRTYGDILPAHLLEAKTIRELQGNYEEATNAIYNYVAAKTKEAQIRHVAENEGQAVADSAAKAAEKIKEYVKENYNAEISSSRILEVLGRIRKEWESGAVNVDNYKERFRELMKEYTGIEDIELPLLEVGKWYKPWEKITVGIGAYYDDFINKVYFNTEKINAIMADGTIRYGNLINTNLNEEKKSIDAKAKELQGALNTLAMSKDEKSIVTDEQVKAAEKKILDFYKSIGKEAPKLSEIINDSFLIKKETIELNKLVYTDWLNDITHRTIAKSDFGSYLKYTEDLQKSIKKFDGTEFQQFISNTIEEFAKINNMSTDGLDKFLANAEDNIDSYVKRLKPLIESIKEQIYLLQLPGSYIREGLTDEEINARIEQLKKEQKLIADIYEKNHYSEKDQKKGESEAEKRLRKQLALIKEIGKAYEDNLKYYNKEDALAKTKKDYASAAKEAGIEKLVLETDLDPAGLISALEKLSKTASSKVKLDIERAIGDIKGQLDLDVKIKDVEGIKKQLDDLFAGYELSVEMDKLGLDESLINQLFNVDTFSIDDIKKKLSQIFPDVSKLSKEQLKVYEDTNKKIAGLEKKALESRLKDYTAYLKKSVSERVRIEMEGQKKIADIPAEFRPDQRNEIANNIKKETQKKLDQQDWADFQNSDLYIKLFEDLDNVSTKTLNTLRQKLLDLKQSLKDLPASELRAITSQIKKVEDELSERNPFKGLGRTIKDYISSLKDLRRLENERTKSLTRENELEDQVKTQERYYNLKEQEYNNAVKTYGVNSQQAKEAEKRLKDSYSILSSTKSELALQKGVTSEIEDQQDAAQKLRKKLEEAANAFGKRMGEVNDLLSDIQSAFGGMMSDSANDMLSSAQEIISGTVKTAEGLGQMASGDWIGGGLKALGGLASTIGSVFDIGDKKKERQIQDEIKLVGRLQKAYEKLEQAIDDAYTIDTLNRSYENAEQNLKAQNESLQRMIAAEESKKKSDKDKIEEWQNQIEENNQKRLELESQKIADLGGFGSGASMASAAEEFASAWIDAFRETGDGLSALEDKWDEYIKNVIVKQLALRGITKFLEPIMGMIDDAIKNDSYLSTEELDKIKEEVKKTVPEMNDFFKSIMEGFGDMIPSTNDSDLTGMQKGIQSVTEEQAGVIEAYLNSIRFFVADSNLQLQSIALLVSRDPAQNPIYSELMAQTRLLRSIDDRLSSVITAAGNHQLGGFAIKSII